MTDFWIAGGGVRAGTTPGQPDIRLGEVLDATAVIRNLGQEGGAEDVSVRFYLSTDRILSSDDVSLEIRYITVSPFTDLSDDGQVRVTQPIPGRMTPGDYFLIAQVDYYDEFAETNEGNNAAVINNYARGFQSDLESYFIRIGPSEAALATTGELFATRGGKNGFLSELALAAYHLDTANDHEVDGPGSNAIRPRGELAFDGLPDGFALLNGSDLPDLPLTGGTSEFFRDGMGNGIYTSENAAALLGRSQNALFIAFRGTNDNGPGSSPDVQDWFNNPRHFDLFDDMFTALNSYLLENPGITKIYVTGHSLGGAMVEALMRSSKLNPSGLATEMEAVSFAAPGYPRSTVNATEQVQANYTIFGDVVPWFDAAYRAMSGDTTQIDHNLFEEFLEDGTGGRGDLHSMQLYRDFIMFFESEGIFSSYQNGRDYDHILAHANVVSTTEQLYEIGVYDDTITGYDRAEIILGGGGADSINGRRGDDFIKGGSSDDTINGSFGHDYIEGNGGYDIIEGGLKDDTIKGGNGWDTLSGNQGTDTIYGGAGRDEIYGGIDGDDLFGGSNADLIYGRNGGDDLTGGRGMDEMYGGDGDDELYGGGNNDQIYGGDNRDTLMGGSGNDQIEGGNGRDALYGGIGADYFVFDSVRATNSQSNLFSADTIHDWDTGQGRDKIDLSQIDAQRGILNAGNQSFSWIGDSGFSGTKGELRYKNGPNNTLVLGDRNGDGDADMQIIITGQHRLTMSDFEL